MSGYSSSLASNKLQLSFLIDENQPGIVAGNQKLHEGIEMEGIPLIRFEVKIRSAKAFDFIRIIASHRLTGITIKTYVKGIHQPVIESDMGVLQADKPFFPFTAQPKKGSSLYLDYPEWKNKNLTRIRLQLQWANAPDSFKELYFGYREFGDQLLSKDTYVAQNFVPVASSITSIKNLIWQPSGIQAALQNNQIQINKTPSNLIVNDDQYFKYDLSIRNGANWQKQSSDNLLFEKEEDAYFTKLEINPATGYQTIPLGGGIRLTLVQSFLYEMYPRLYALAMSSEQPETLIPNEPYTPLVEQITMEYETSETFSMGQDNSLVFWLTDDFGHFEEKRSIKEQIKHVRRKQVQLFSFPSTGGELIIGLADLEPGQQLSMLFHVFEGSENPLQSNFGPEEKIQWSVLYQNYWKPLDRQSILSDDTDNFLRSGIIRFQLPKEAFGENTRMDGNLIWLRAYSSKAFDATCQLTGIHPNAVLATFENRGNDLGHLNNGLPEGTISKMVERISGVKSLYQPYNSFGGASGESDNDFYIGVSERLRHKNRSVSLWDYEHLVLENFPEIHKVKCLNHTSELSFMAPGHVLLIVIPDTVNKNVYDIFQPMVSTTKLNEIAEFLKSKVSPAIQIKTVNPLYEEVRIQLEVKFKNGLDEAFHKNQMEQDIIRYLSPWTQKTQNALSFGVNLQESLLIHHLEKLNYLDYIKDLVLYKNKEPHWGLVQPSSPRHILVSAKTHELRSVS